MDIEAIIKYVTCGAGSFVPQACAMPEISGVYMPSTQPRVAA